MTKKYMPRIVDYKLSTLIQDPVDGYAAKNMTDAEYAVFAKQKLEIDFEITRHHVSGVRGTFDIPASLGRPARAVGDYNALEGLLLGLEQRVKALEDAVDSERVARDEIRASLTRLTRMLEEHRKLTEALERAWRLGETGKVVPHGHSGRPS